MIQTESRIVFIVTGFSNNLQAAWITGSCSAIFLFSSFFHITYDYARVPSIKIKILIPQILCLFELLIPFLSWYFSVSRQEKTNRNSS